MSKIQRLLQSYSKHITVPWRSDAAAAQRVIFCIYDAYDELRLQANIDEFSIATHNANHDWNLFDMTDTFAEWLSNQRYAKRYFEQPELLTPLLPKYLDFITKKFEAFLSQKNCINNSVIALIGVGSLFGFIKIKDVVDKLSPLVSGRLLVFFPGSYDENNNYRLFDAYDGWNYLAVPITANKDF